MNELLELLARFNELTDDERTRLGVLLSSDGEDAALVDLSDDELASLLDTLTATFEAADDEDVPDVDAMETIAGHIESVRSEQAARDEAAEADRARADEIRNRVRPDAAEDEPVAQDDPDEGESEDEPADEPAPESVAAAATRRAVARRRPRSEPRPDDDAQGAQVIVASAETGFETGTQITQHQLGEALANRIDALMAAGSSGKRLAGSRYNAGRVMLDYPDEFMLRRSDSVGNRERLDAATGPAALLASGGICRTAPADYDLPGVESDARPIRDAFARFGAERGGVRILPTPTLADATGGVGVWTNATDTTPGQNTKNLLVIDCGTEDDPIYVHAVTMRAQIGNFQRQFFPELWDRYQRLLNAAHARLAEDTLWNNMVALATAVTHGQSLGASRDFLTGLDQAVAAFRFRHRIADAIRINWFVPFWVRNLIRMDLTRQLPGDDVMNVTDEQIDAMIRARGVNPIYSLDGGANNTIGAQAAGALIDLPTTVESVFAVEGAYVFLDGGTIDYGAQIVDSTLASTNDVQSFMETFEGVYQNSVEALAVTFTVCPSGSSVGTTTAVECAGS
jgi:hypothetical protein